MCRMTFFPTEHMYLLSIIYNDLKYVYKDISVRVVFLPIVPDFLYEQV